MLAIRCECRQPATNYRKAFTFGIGITGVQGLHFKFVFILTGIVLTTIAVILRILSNPLGNVFQKQLTSKGIHPLIVSFFTYLGLSLLCIPIASRAPWGQLSSQFWLFSVLGGICGALGNGFLVRALQLGDLSVLGPINAYKSIVGIIVGIFLLGELPNSWGLVGMALIIWGSYFVLDTTEDKFSWSLFKRKEIQYRLWAMILTAIEAVLEKKVILASSVTLAFLSWCWFGALFSFFLVYRCNLKQQVRYLTSNYFSKYVYLLACIGIMQLTTNYVFAHMPVGYALALFQLSVIVSVLLGHRIFKEQDIRKRLLGSVIMIVGSVVIILLKNN
jgi:drug/metabolite transporter (DMT)-like permease